jgi:hypothetical protein
MLVFAIYMVILSVTLTFFPYTFTALFRMPTPDGLWIRLLGVILGILAFYYLMAVREGNETFYRWSSLGRLVIFPAVAVLVALAIAPPVLLLLATWDTGCGIWTGLALRREQAAGG